MHRIKALFVLTWVAAASVHGAIEYARVFRDDRPLIEVTRPFGFGSRGHIDISLRDITLWRRHDQVDEDYNLAKFGFFLGSMDSQYEMTQDLMAGNCLLNNRDFPLFKFSDKNVQAVVDNKKANVTFRVDITDGGLSSVYFANCEHSMPVSFEARVESYNLVGPEGRKDYLSIGESELDVMYWVMFSLFTVITAAWAYTLTRSKRNKTVYKIHWLMLVLVTFKTLTLLTQAIMYLVIERQGSAHGWNWVYYITTFLRGSLFFAVVVLIGTGWSYMRPFLDDNTRKLLMVVLPLQVFANIAIIITTEESPAFSDWWTWQTILHIIDIVCCCAILFPIVWSIMRLRQASETDGKAARCREKLVLFTQFYVAVVVFIYFTRIVAFLLSSNLQAGYYAWVSDAVYELAYLAFYVWVGVKFRPSSENPYTKLRQEEIELTA